MKKRIVIKPKQKLINKYEKFILGVLKSIEQDIKKRDGNKFFFTDGKIEIFQEDVAVGIVDFANGFITDTIEYIEESLGNFDEKDKPFINTAIEGNVILVSSIATDHKKNLMRIISDGVTSGLSITEIKNQLTEQYNLMTHRAETIAITETAKANSKFALKRLKELNITNAIWSSAKDKRVRKCHLARNGKKYQLNKGCYSECDGKFIQTGFEIRCRCAIVISL